MKKIIFLLLVVFHLSKLSFSQSVGVGTTSPDNSAILDVQSTSKGMLVPRIALTAANAASPVTSPADALLIYNTASAGSGINAVAPGFYHWQSSISRWVAISSATTSNNTAGFGGWGDCSVQNVSGYNPVVASDGADGDNFGSSVSISGNFAIIGAHNDNNLNGTSNVGSAYIFFFNGVSWVQQQKIAASDGAANDNFGISVSMFGNFAVVGAASDDIGIYTDQGSAYIFFYNGSSWVQTQKLAHASGGSGDRFGFSTCIKGNSLIIGAWGDDVGANTQQGSADIFIYNGSTWVLQGQVTASDGLTDDFFGFSVTIDGNWAIIGAPYDDIGANANQGSVYVFKYNGSTWGYWQKVTRPVFGAADYNFGYSVSMSATYCIIGEPDYGSTQAGAVHVLTYNNVTWTYLQDISIPGISPGPSYAGRSVFISGDYFITGALGVDVNGVNDAGKLFIYKNFSGYWRLYEDFADPAAGWIDGIGGVVAMDNVRFVTGAQYAPVSNQRGFALFGKIE